MLNQLARRTFCDTKRLQANLEKFIVVLQDRKTKVPWVAFWEEKKKKRLHKLNGINGILNGFTQKRDTQTEKDLARSKFYGKKNKDLWTNYSIQPQSVLLGKNKEKLLSQKSMRLKMCMVFQFPISLYNFIVYFFGLQQKWWTNVVEKLFCPKIIFQFFSKASPSFGRNDKNRFPPDFSCRYWNINDSGIFHLSFLPKERLQQLWWKKSAFGNGIFFFPTLNDSHASQGISRRYNTSSSS